MNQGRVWGAGLAIVAASACHDFGGQILGLDRGGSSGSAGMHDAGHQQGGQSGEDNGGAGLQDSDGGSSDGPSGGRGGSKGADGGSTTDAGGSRGGAIGGGANATGGSEAPGSGGAGEAGVPTGGTGLAVPNEGGMDAGGRDGAEGGTAGAVAASGASGGGVGGTAGSTEDPGWPVPQFCSDDEGIVPVCYTELLEGTPLMPLSYPRHVAVATLAQWGGWHLVVTERGGHTVRIVWGDESIDLDWRCFDTVPHGDRVAGTSMTNDFPEWYATTKCGEIFARRMVPYRGERIWGPWAPMSLPLSSSFVLDVATSMSSDGINYLFVIDRGHVYQRHRIGTEAASFSPWAKVPTPPSKLLAAGLRNDGRQQLFVVDDLGAPFTCIQSSTELGASFESCIDFDSADVPELIHISAPYRVPEGSPVLALDVDGGLWARFQDGSGGYGPWQPFPVAAPEPFVSVSGAGVPNRIDAPLRVAGVTDSGGVLMIVRRSGAWGPWESVD